MDIRNIIPDQNKDNTQPSEYDILRALGGAITSPLQTAKGVAKGVTEVLQGLGGIITGPFRDYLPNQLQEFISGQPAEEDIETKERIWRVLNIPTLGIPETFRQELKKQGEDVPRYDRAAWKTIMHFLPIEESLTLVSGRNPETNQILTPEEVGKTGFDFVLKTLPLSWTMQRFIKPAILRGVEKPPPRIPQTKAQLKAASEKTVVSTPEEPPIVSPELRAKIAELEKTMGVRFSEQDIISATLDAGHPIPGAPGEKSKYTEFRLEPEQVDALRAKTLEHYTILAKKDPEALTSILTKTAIRMNLHPERYKASQHFADLLVTGQMDPASLPQALREQMIVYGAPASDVISMYAMIAEAIERTGSYFGKGLGVYSSLNKAMLKLFSDNPEITQAVQAMSRVFKIPDSYPSLFLKINHNIHRWVRFIKGMLVSQPATTMRNIQVQTSNALLHGLENAFVDTGLALLGKSRAFIKGEASVPLRLYYQPTIATFTDALASMAAPVVRTGQTLAKKQPTFMSVYDTVMDALTSIERHLLEGSPIAGDIAVQNIFKRGYWKEKMKSLKEPGERLDATLNMLTDTFTSMNRTQEILNRRFFFIEGLARGLRKYHYENWEQFIADLRNPKGMPSKFVLDIGKPTPDILSTVRKLRENLESVAIDVLGNRISEVRALGGDKAVKSLMEKTKVRLAHDLTEIENRVKKGDNTWDILNDIDPALAPQFGGKIENAGLVISEAIDHALRGTFSFSYHPYTFQGRVLKLWQEMPILGPLVNYFPRFIFNMWSWITERNPFQFMDLLSRDYRNKLLGEVKEAIKDPRGRDLTEIYRMTRAAEGTALLAAAHMVRNSPLGGPKYYQIRMGVTKDGKEEFADMRPFQPFSQFLFIVDAAKAAHEGKMPNLTASEFSDAILNVRRMSEVPVFAFLDLVRSINSKTPEAFITNLKELLAQPLAAPFLPMRVIIDAMQAAGIGPETSLRDVEGNELFGPVMANIPGLHGLLPPRIDPSTGKPMVAPRPMLRQFGGITTQRLTPIDVLAQEVNLNPRSLTGDYGTPDANRMVDQFIGEILNTPTRQGKTLNEVLAQKIRESTKGLPVEWRREQLRRLYSILRKIAVTKARLLNPQAFIEHDIKTRLSEPIQSIVRGMLKK